MGQSEVWALVLLKEIKLKRQDCNNKAMEFPGQDHLLQQHVER